MKSGLLLPGRSFGQLAQKAGVSFGHYGTEFVPEVEHVSQQVYGRVPGDAVQEVDQPPFLRFVRVRWLGEPRWSIREETLYILHFQLSIFPTLNFQLILPKESQPSFAFFAHHVLVPLGFKTRLMVAEVTPSMDSTFWRTSSMMKSAAGQLGQSASCRWRLLPGRRRLFL